MLHRPSVLVADAGIATVRELLGVLENQMPTGRPLVVVAPAIGDELLATFEVNHIRQVITILPVIVADDADRRRIADHDRSPADEPPDLQSGYLVPGLLGCCATWVSSSTRRPPPDPIDDR